MNHRQIGTGVALAALLLITVAGCGFPTQTNYSVPNDGGLRTLVFPDDAEVFVDGGSMGAASQYRGGKFIQIKAGKHIIEIKKDGYLPYHEEVFVNGNIRVITVTLKKAGS